MRYEVLGLPVDKLTCAETVDKISEWIRVESKQKMVVTAYSEFYVNAQSDKEFARIIKSADLVTPDGVSVLAAVEYLQTVSKIKRIKDLRALRFFKLLLEGLKVGGKILSGKVGETVTGVWLFNELTKLSVKKGWKVFLLGGWGNVSERTATMLLERFPGIKVLGDPGEERVGSDELMNAKIVKKINAFKPDLLFVQYNPVKQEKWIASNLKDLKVGVAMGVGGTFNEYLGDFKKAPHVMETIGLKWLWRVIVEPRRFGRIMKAVIVFPWLVFRSSL